MKNRTQHRHKAQQRKTGIRTHCGALALLFLLLSATGIHAARIKDLANIAGVRNNQLMGYGLIIGLNGTGDDMNKSVFTKQAMVNMVRRMGMSLSEDTFSNMKSDNVAAVMVTATLPAFAKPGTTIDVQVSSMGDAESLSGGTLLMTPLKGPDGKTYAVAQGAMSNGAISFGGKTAKVQKNFPTAGRIAGGAMVERAVNFQLPPSGKLSFQLRDRDFTTASRMAEAINTAFTSPAGPIARPMDAGAVSVQIPPQFVGNVVSFIADVENVEVIPDAPARIVVNERTGTIVMGQDVKISKVAVSHGNLNLVISEPIEVSQPNPLAGGDTVATPATSITVSEEGGNLVVIEPGVNIGEIAKALNAIGASPRDLIAIFQAIKAAGALQGELVIL